MQTLLPIPNAYFCMNHSLILYNKYHTIKQCWYKQFMLLFGMTHLVIIMYIKRILNYFHKGKWDMKCSSILLMVCGSDNNNYVNECALNKTICEDITGKLKKRHHGACEGIVRNVDASISLTYALCNVKFNVH